MNETNLGMANKQILAIYPLLTAKNAIIVMKIQSELIKTGSGCFCVMLQSMKAGRKAILANVKAAISLGLFTGFLSQPAKTLPT